MPTSFDARRYRDVLGQYPTGVCVVSAVGTDGRASGLAVGSFTSVSLDPPLVAFFPDRSSSSWPKIEAAGSFCVNVLAAHQEEVCRALAAKSDDKFKALIWRPAGSGSPILEGAVAWIDCDIESVQEAGDHYIVIGRVRELDNPSTDLPLLFFRGGYGRFAPLSFASGDADLLEQLGLVDLTRPIMEEVAAELHVECAAASVVGSALVYVATAGRPMDASATRVGRRLPYVPPIGASLAAWSDSAAQEHWLDQLGPDSLPARRRWESVLGDIRRRGYLVGLGHDIHASIEQRFLTEKQPPVPVAAAGDVDALIGDLRIGYEQGNQHLDALEVGAVDPDVDPNESCEARTIIAPVFGPGGRPLLQLVLWGLPYSSTWGGVQSRAQRLREAAQRATHAVGGHQPDPDRVQTGVSASRPRRTPSA